MVLEQCERNEGRQASCLTLAFYAIRSLCVIWAAKFFWRTGRGGSLCIPLRGFRLHLHPALYWQLWLDRHQRDHDILSFQSAGFQVHATHGREVINNPV
jgi:hypothetical protein